MQIDLLSMVGALVPGIGAKQKPEPSTEFENELDGVHAETDRSTGTDRAETRSVDESKKDATSVPPIAEDTKPLDPSEDSKIDPTLSVLTLPWVAPPLVAWPSLSTPPLAPSPEFEVVPMSEPGITATLPTLNGQAPLGVSPLSESGFEGFMPPVSEADMVPSATVQVHTTLVGEATKNGSLATLTPPSEASVAITSDSGRIQSEASIGPKSDVAFVNPTRMAVAIDLSALPIDESKSSADNQLVASVIAAEDSTKLTVDPTTKAQFATPELKPLEVKVASQSGHVEPSPTAELTTVVASGAQNETPDDQNPDSTPAETVSAEDKSLSQLPTPTEQKVTAGKPGTIQTPEKEDAVLDTQTTIREVVDRIESMVTRRGNGSVTIHLEPRELGQLILTVKQLNGKVEAEIQATDPKVREQLASNQAQLHQQIERKGYQVESLRFTEPTMQQSTQQGNSQNQEQLTQDDFHRAQHLRSSTPEVAVSTTSEPWWNRNSDGFDVTA